MDSCRSSALYQIHVKSAFGYVYTALLQDLTLFGFHNLGCGYAVAERKSDNGTNIEILAVFVVNSLNITGGYAYGSCLVFNRFVAKLNDILPCGKCL